jgi:hypothetical protein
MRRSNMHLIGILEGRNVKIQSLSNNSNNSWVFLKIIAEGINPQLIEAQVSQGRLRILNGTLRHIIVKV